MSNPTTPHAVRTLAALAALVVAAIATLAACALTPGAGSLGGREFLSRSVTVDGVDRPLVARTHIRLSFEDGRLGVSAGCNHIGGNYRLDGGRLLIDAASMTEMGCDPARHAQDDWLAGFLSSAPTVLLDGHTLQLTAGGTVVTLDDRRVADPDRPLVGTTWVVAALIGPGAADGAVSSIPDDVVASLRFHEDGSVDVETGCNQGGGRWTLDGRTIRIADVALTKRGCGGPEAQVEAAMVILFGGDPIRVAVEAGSMTLATGAGGLQLQAR